MKLYQRIAQILLEGDKVRKKNATKQQKTKGMLKIMGIWQKSYRFTGDEVEEAYEKALKKLHPKNCTHSKASKALEIVTEARNRLLESETVRKQDKKAEKRAYICKNNIVGLKNTFGQKIREEALGSGQTFAKFTKGYVQTSKTHAPIKSSASNSNNRSKLPNAPYIKPIPKRPAEVLTKKSLFQQKKTFQKIKFSKKFQKFVVICSIQQKK